MFQSNCTLEDGLHPKSAAIRTITPSVTCRAIVDGVMEALAAHDQGRLPKVNALQAPSTANSGARAKKTASRESRQRPVSHQLVHLAVLHRSAHGTLSGPGESSAP